MHTYSQVHKINISTQADYTGTLFKTFISNLITLCAQLITTQTKRTRCWIVIMVNVTAGSYIVSRPQCILFPSLQVRLTWWSLSGVWLWLLWWQSSAPCSCLWDCVRCLDWRLRSMEGRNAHLFWKIVQKFWLHLLLVDLPAGQRFESLCFSCKLLV